MCSRTQFKNVVPSFRTLQLFVHFDSRAVAMETFNNVLLRVIHARDFHDDSDIHFRYFHIWLRIGNVFYWLMLFLWFWTRSRKHEEKSGTFDRKGSYEMTLLDENDSTFTIKIPVYRGIWKKELN